MRPRTVFLLIGTAIVFTGLGFGLGLSRPRVVNAAPSPSVGAKSVPSTSLHAGPVTVKPNPAKSDSGDVSLGRASDHKGEVNGVVELRVPPSAPEKCSPSDITV